MMKKVFYFILKALFIPRTFKFWLWVIGSVEETDKVNFKIHDVTAWSKNNYNTYIVQYLAK